MIFFNKKYYVNETQVELLKKLYSPSTLYARDYKGGNACKQGFKEIQTRVTSH